jgi:hypothetical protein
MAGSLPAGAAPRPRRPPPATPHGTVAAPCITGTVSGAKYQAQAQQQRGSKVVAKARMPPVLPSAASRRQGGDKLVFTKSASKTITAGRPAHSPLICDSERSRAGVQPDALVTP